MSLNSDSFRIFHSALFSTRKYGNALGDQSNSSPLTSVENIWRELTLLFMEESCVHLQILVSVQNWVKYFFSISYQAVKMHCTCLDLGYGSGGEAICFLWHDDSPYFARCNYSVPCPSRRGIQTSTIKHFSNRRQDFMTLQWQDQWFYAP